MNLLVPFEMRKKSNNKQPVELKTNGEQSIQEIFGQSLKTLREEKGLSQEAMAFISGLSRSYYAEVESGKRNVSLINITKISVALDVELNKILSLSESKKNFK